MREKVPWMTVNEGVLVYKRCIFCSTHFVGLEDAEGHYNGCVRCIPEKDQYLNWSSSQRLETS